MLRLEANVGSNVPDGKGVGVRRGRGIVSLIWVKTVGVVVVIKGGGDDEGGGKEKDDFDIVGVGGHVKEAANCNNC